MNESDFQYDVIKEIEAAYPGVIVLKNDPRYLQGFPDWTILYKKNWAALEIKISRNARKQANQKFWVHTANSMSYSSFLFPENRLEVLNELQYALRSDR